MPQRYLKALISLTKIALLSDTHGYIDDSILKYCNQPDEIWHAGDIGKIEVIEKLQTIAPVKAVFGNIDNTLIRKSWPEHQRFKTEDVDVWITHIGGYPGRYDRRVKSQISLNPPKLFICGHSHILKVMNDKNLGLLHMNPGAIGKNGFHKQRTMLRFKIEADRIFDLEVVELKR